MLSNQKLKITIPPIQDGPYSLLYMEFSDTDTVKTAIDTDDKSYTSIFYIEVIRKKKIMKLGKKLKRDINQHYGLRSIYIFC